MAVAIIGLVVAVMMQIQLVICLVQWIGDFIKTLPPSATYLYIAANIMLVSLIISGALL